MTIRRFDRRSFNSGHFDEKAPGIFTGILKAAMMKINSAASENKSVDKVRLLSSPSLPGVARPLRSSLFTRRKRHHSPKSVKFSGFMNAI